MSPTDTGLPEAHETQPRAHVATFRWLQGDGSSNLCVSFDAGPFLISTVHTTTALTGQEMLRNAKDVQRVRGQGAVATRGAQQWVSPCKTCR
jgi:hypothetical protein